MLARGMRFRAYGLGSCNLGFLGRLRSAQPKPCWPLAALPAAAAMSLLLLR